MRHQAFTLPATALQSMVSPLAPRPYEPRVVLQNRLGGSSIGVNLDPTLRPKKANDAPQRHQNIGGSLIDHQGTLLLLRARLL